MGNNLATSPTSDTQIRLREAAESDPIGRAYLVLRDAAGADPLVIETKRQLWRRLWARNTVNNWLEHAANQPRFLQSIYKGIPEEDPELLNEIKTAAESIHDNNAIYGLVCLVNDRLARFRRLAKGDVLKDRSGQNILIPTFGKENYDGFVCCGVQSKDGKWIVGGEDSPVESACVPVKSKCLLAVWMQPEPSTSAWCAELSIETGHEEDIVNFSVEVDSATLSMAFGRKRLSFHRKSKSTLATFAFVAPPTTGEHILYVHVIQETRLVKSMLVVLRIGKQYNTKSCALKGPRRSGSK